MQIFVLINDPIYFIAYSKKSTEREGESESEKAEIVKLRYDKQFIYLYIHDHNIHTYKI